MVLTRIKGEEWMCAYKPRCSRIYRLSISSPVPVVLGCDADAAEGDVVDNITALDDSGAYRRGQMRRGSKFRLDGTHVLSVDSSGFLV